MAEDREREDEGYEAPELTELGTIEEWTKGPSVFGITVVI